MIGLLHALGDELECLAAVAQYGYIGLYVLAELRLVNVKVYDLGLLGICAERACYAIVKTHADCNQDIAFIGLYVGSQITVHTEHTHVERVVRWQGGKSQKGACCGQVSLLDESGQFLLGITQFYAVTYQYERFLGAVDQGYGLIYL